MLNYAKKIECDKKCLNGEEPISKLSLTKTAIFLISIDGNPNEKGPHENVFN